MTMDLEVLRGSRILVPEESGARHHDVIADSRHAIRWNVRGPEFEPVNRIVARVGE